MITPGMPSDSALTIRNESFPLISARPFRISMAARSLRCQNSPSTASDSLKVSSRTEICDFEE
jgi:hypothetical protein